MEKAEFDDRFMKAGFKPSIQPFAAPGSSDRPSEIDHLDRTRHVNALAALISHQRTEVPLTIGIYGEWGSGKSSFMQQLERMLSRKHQTVQFNAWRYSDAEDLWAELVNSIATALDRQLSIFMRLWFLAFSGSAKGARAGVSKLWGRLLAGARRLENWLITPIAGAGLLKLTGNFGLPNITTSEFLNRLFDQEFLQDAAAVLQVIGIILVAISVVVIFYKIARILLRPFSTQFEIYLSRYKSGTEERRRLTQSDLNTISKMLTNIAERTSSTKPPIVVFLDDLDRCPPDRIVEVLEAVNLFFEGLPFVTVFGLSPKVVSMAIAHEYEFLLRKNSSIEEQESFGRSFLQKIIHIPFQLPRAQQLETYVRNLMVHIRDEQVTDSDQDTILNGKESLQRYSGIKRIVRMPYTIYVDLAIRLGRRRAVSSDQIYQLGVVNRLLHGLQLLPAQEEWLRARPPHERILLEQFKEKLEWEQPSFFKLPRILQFLRTASEDALSVEMEMETSDAQLLLRYSAHLMGNPRTIKRFVNVYQLAKGINAQLPQPQQVKMQGLAAWLVLLQNWPKEGARLQKSAVLDSKNFLSKELSSYLAKPPARELENFVNQYKKQLISLAKHPEGIEIAGCFSFLSSPLEANNTA